MMAAPTNDFRARYRLTRKLGEGGMGVVWEGVEIATNRPCAVKLVRPESNELETRRRVLQEAELLKQISHPNIVRIFAIDSCEGAPAIVMELLRGETLADLLERRRYLSIGQSAAILTRVAAAVKAAHDAGVIHRDLKPDNVFLCMDDAGIADVRVLDFGVAKKVEAAPDKLTKTGTLIGTPYYMSPEQAAGERALDGRSDTWAVAVMAFECITGQMPVTGENYGQLLSRLIRHEVTRLSELRPDLPADLVEAIDNSLSPRDQRPGVDVLSQTLSRYADAVIAPPAMAPPVMQAENRMTDTVAIRPEAEPESRGLPRTVTIGLAAFGVVALLTFVGGFVAHSRHGRAAGQGAPASVSIAADTGAVSTPPASTEPTAASTPSAQESPPTPTPPPSGSVEAATAQVASTTTSIKPASSARPSGSAHRAPSASAGRLQGGVAGDVPF